MQKMNLILYAALSGPAIAISLPAWSDEVGRQVGQLRELGVNWDGRGSAAVSRDVLIFAWYMLWQIMMRSTTPPSLIPLGDGGVQLLWSNDIAEVAVEVIRPNDISIYYLEHTTGEEREWNASTEFSELAGLLRTKFSQTIHP
jgi:hypothetical protein